MQRVIDEMKRTAENHGALTEPVPVPLLTLERWIEEIETAYGVAADIKYLRKIIADLQSEAWGLGHDAREVEDTIDRLADLLGDGPQTSVQTTMEVG